MQPTSLSPAGRARLPRRAAALGAVFGGLVFTQLVLRPWYTSWGATAAEQSEPFPGDGIAPGPVRETRAIAIAAPAEQVFAWVAQLGQDRAGFYSYELLEDLVGCEMPNLGALDPALQQWRVGDALWMYPPDKLDGKGHATLIHYEPGVALVFGTNTPVDPPGSPPTGSWSFLVKPTGPDASRLLTRASGGSIPSLLGSVYTLAVFEPVHFAMERRMLEGIRGLAEGRPISPLRDALQICAWFTTLVLFVASGVLALLGSRFRRGLVVFAASGLAFQLLTLAQPPPALGVALVLALCAALFGRAPRRTGLVTRTLEQAS